MLTFFRRIRKGLLGDGATSKYLLYAVGEIALVVIGILIALQINNWNNDRINRKSEKEGLVRIVQDLKKDLDYIKPFQSSSEQRLWKGVWILEKLGANTSTIKNWKMYEIATINLSSMESAESDPFGRVLVSLRFYNVFEESATTFQEFLSTGKLDLIDDQKIRASIQSHYSAVNRAKQHQHLLVQNREVMIAYLRKHGISMTNTLSLEEINGRIGQSDELIAIIENFLSVTRRMHNTIISSENSVKNLTERLIDNIERYLRK